jgi:hypothetical protein
VIILKTIFHLIYQGLFVWFSAIYMYRRKVSLAQINAILLAIGLPIVSTTIYLILYTPSVVML